MNLADKPCYPILNDKGVYDFEYIEGHKNDAWGLTFRERLIIALASNPMLIKQDERIINRDADIITKEGLVFVEDSAEMIIKFADAIIKQLEAK